MANWLDLGLIVLLGFAVLGGFRRGLLRELAGIVALILAFMLSARYVDSFAIYLSTQLGLGFGLARLLAFLGIWLGLLWGLQAVASTVCSLLPAPLGSLNALGGALFALSKQVLVICIILSLVATVPFVSNLAAWQESRLLPEFLALVPAIAAFGQKLWPNFPWQPEPPQPQPPLPLDEEFNLI